MIHSDSITRRIVDYIRANPGATRPSMLSVLPDDTKPRSVSSILGHLSRHGAIENRGRGGRGAKWYAIEIFVDPKFRKMARELIVDLRNVHHTQREDWLAKRLQELCSK